MGKKYIFQTGSINESKPAHSLRGMICGLIFYSMLCLLQVWPVQEVRAQNYLDNVGLPTTQAVAAYSVRKLSSFYSGPAMQVRRSFDNIISNVAFDVNNVVSASSVVTIQLNTSLTLGILTTTFPGKPGTISYTSGSTAVTGNATAMFSTNLNAGDILVDLGTKKMIGIVSMVNSNTSVTLTSTAVATGSSKTYGASTSTPAFSAFYGPTSSSCYVSTWFDQSGNSGARDAVQPNTNSTTMAKQPRIVRTGVFELNGTLPGLYFAGAAAQTLTAPFTGITVAYPVTMSLLANDSGLATKGAFLRFGGGTGSAGISIGVGDSAGTFSIAGKSVIGSRSSTPLTWSPASPDVRYPSTHFTSTTTQTLTTMRNFLNGLNVLLANSGSAPQGTTITGGIALGGSSPTFKQSEMIIFDFRLPTLARQALECNQQLFYSILTASAGATQNICSGLTSNQLGGNTPFFGLTGRWSQVSGPGNSTFSNITSGSSNATATVAGTYVYRWLVSNGSCSASATITVNFSEPTSVGIDQNVCGSLTSDPLGGNIPAIGTGQWSIISAPAGAPSPSANFSDPNAANATVTGTLYGSYVFRWTVTGGTCSPLSADIKINFSSSTLPPPTAVISGSANTCPGASTTISVNLTGTGPWNLSYTDGVDVINVPGIMTSPYTFPVSPAQTTTYKITSVTDQYCKAQLFTLNATAVVTVAPKVTITADYCTLGGGQVKLTADTHTNYLWSNGATTKSTSVTQSGFYSVKVDDGNPSCFATTSISIGEELVYNGDFELGTAGLNSDYTRATVPMAGCSTGGLYLATYYDVVTNPQVDHCNFWGVDHTNGGGSFMAVNGAPDTLAVWKTNSITVKKNTRYYFSAWAMSLNSVGSFAALKFKIGNYQAGSTAVLTAGISGPANNGWKRFSGFWDSGDTTDIAISIINTNTGGTGNDFGLDDISFSTLPTFTLSTTASATGGTNFNTCDAVDLVPTVIGGWSPLSYNWTYASGPSTLEKPTIPLITPADNTIALTVTDGKGCVASANIALTISDINRTWLGVNTDWFNSSNWCGGVPDGTKDVIIPIMLSGIYPIINTGTASVKNININSGATVTIDGGILQIGVDVANLGTFDATQGAVEFNGTSPQTILGSWFKNNSIGSLIATNTTGVSVSATVADSLNILDSLAFGQSNVTLTTNDNLILASTATSTARVTDITHHGTHSNDKVVGKVTVQRYYPALRAWRLVTSPLSNTGPIFDNWQNGGINVSGKGTLVTGPAAAPSVNGLDLGPNNSSSMKYKVSLSPVLNTKTQLLSGNTPDTANIGYFLFVRGDRDPANTNGINKNITTLSSKGNLQTGPQKFSADNTLNGFTLIGNPYASPVDFSTVKKNNIVDRFIAWDPQGGQSAVTVGAYVYVDALGFPGSYVTLPPSVGGQDEIIQSSQAFFVQTASNGPASIEFNETDKSIRNNLGMFRPSSGQRPVVRSFRINLYLSTSTNPKALADGTLVEFSDTWNPGIDFRDAVKFTNTNETLGLLRDNRSLAIERRPLLTADDTLFIQLSRTTQRSYQWEFAPLNLDPLLTAWLEDSYTGLKTPLNISANSTFNFVINGESRSAATNRFRIVFKKSGGPLPVTYKSIRAYRQDANNAVEWSVENEINIIRYEVEKSADGINFVKVNATPATGASQNSADYKWLDESPLSGNNFYRIRSVGIDGKIEYSNIVLVKTGQATASGIRIYPNPVTNGIIGAEFKNMTAGVYDIKLINNLGQTILSQTIPHAAGTSIENIKPAFKLVTGIYQLKVTAPTKEISTIKVIIK